jgi:hypothetical protein
VPAGSRARRHRVVRTSSLVSQRDCTSATGPRLRRSTVAIDHSITEREWTSGKSSSGLLKSDARCAIRITRCRVADAIKTVSLQSAGCRSAQRCRRPFRPFMRWR